MAIRLLVVTALAIATLNSATAQTPEATSLLGKPLISVPPVGDEKGRLEMNLRARKPTSIAIQIREQMDVLENGNGDAKKAREVFARVLAAKAWATFGFIAAEADVARGF